MVNNINTGCGIPSRDTPRPQRYSFCAPVVSCFVYTCVYSCVPTCTLLYTRVYTEAFITTSFRGSSQLYEWALLCCSKGLVSARAEGLVPARRMDTSLHYGRARADSIDSFCFAPWLASPVLVTASPIDNVPACEAGGNLRCDLELWGEMHYLCRRKSKRGGAQQTRRTRRKRRREDGDVCEKICGEVW